MRIHRVTAEMLKEYRKELVQQERSTATGKEMTNGRSRAAAGGTAVLRSRDFLWGSILLGAGRPLAIPWRAGIYFGKDRGFALAIR